MTPNLQKKTGSANISAKPVIWSFSKRSVRFLSDNNLILVITAISANSVRQLQLAAVFAAREIRSFEFPDCRTSFIASRAGNFPLRYCHYRTPPLRNKKQEASGKKPFRNQIESVQACSCDHHFYQVNTIITSKSEFVKGVL